MRKTLLWMQVILMIAFAKTRLHASSTRRAEDSLLNLSLSETSDSPLSAPITGNKPEFSYKLKDRKDNSRSEAAEPEEDYPHKKFNPLLPPPRNMNLRQTFQRITTKAKGHFFDIVPDEAPEVVNNIIEKNAKPGTDLVFVIDQTGSMDDDVANIQSHVGAKLKEYKDTKDFRVGATTYSNVKTGGEYGFRLHELESDHSYLPGFLRNMEFLGGIEDMYGGVVKTIRLVKWKNGSRRVVVVITDEPPETDPRETDFTEEEMLDIVKREKVELNVILIG